MNEYSLLIFRLPSRLLLGKPRLLDKPKHIQFDEINVHHYVMKSKTRLCRQLIWSFNLYQVHVSESGTVGYTQGCVPTQRHRESPYGRGDRAVYRMAENTRGAMKERKTRSSPMLQKKQQNIVTDRCRIISRGNSLS